MERVGEWRLIEPEEPDPKPAPDPAAPNGGAAGMRLLVAFVAAAVLAAVGIAIWLTLPQGGVALDIAATNGPLPTGRQAAAAGLPEPTVEAELVVDVEGAVVDPGVHHLAAGSRVADAIAAAGGYSPQVDIAAAADALNLAEHVEDGQQIRVPVRGEVVEPGISATDPSDVASGGLIDINHASSTELESLPGIGPVTAGKIIAAREELPFSSIDELDTRDVVGPSVLEDIRDLITVGP